jgi:hypothetical protein
MCECLIKKDCCGCLKGGCECICDCSCHTGDANDPCWAFPTSFCPDCVARRHAVADAFDKNQEYVKERRKQLSEITVAQFRRMVDRWL